MANLTIRNIESETVEALKRRAKSHRRSLEAEVRQILSDVVHPMAPIDLRVLAEKIAAMTPASPQADGLTLLREDRHR